ncbi:MAG: WD40 repeat domain-containing protein [Bacteroidales bacterium]|jgi:hypothetical protein|nr:WD40 repeat domain-containing protein [Bacteroidales bacterium]
MTDILKKTLLLAAFAVVHIPVVFGQVEFMREFESRYLIYGLDNSEFRMVVYTKPTLRTYRDMLIAEDNFAKDFAINPTGSSVAIASRKEVRLYSFRELNKLLKRLKPEKGQVPQTVAWSPDARSFVAGFGNGDIVLYEAQTCLPTGTLSGSTAATELAVSPNNYFVAAVTGPAVDIWNIETKALRTRLALEADATGAAFSTDASMLAVTTVSGVQIYNTRNWELIQAVKTDSLAQYPSFNNEDKYLAYVHNKNTIIIYNLRKQYIEQQIHEPCEIMGMNFVWSDKSTYLLSTRMMSVVYWDASALAPFWGKKLGTELDQKMNDWVKMMQGESMEDYAIRVNDSTRVYQMELFRQQIATELAGNRLAIENPFAGDYNSDEGLLTIMFNTLPPIDIPVPVAEAGTFNDPGKLKFANEVFNLGANDDFELVYVEVTNEVTDKVYIYDHTGRTRLTAIESDLNFVPLEVLQQASQEEAKLKEVKEEVVAADTQEKLISENTAINVDTHVVPDVDTEGNKILNYQVNYKYEVVNKEFSAKDDFAPGVYDVTKSNAAMSLMKIIKQSFDEGDFAKYLEEGKRIKITITGTADGAPIRSKIAYDGRYGDFTDEPFLQNGQMEAMTVNKNTGITTNPQLAFIRAASVQKYLTENITPLQKTKNDYSYKIEVAEERGGEFRKIQIQFTIIDAFKQK